MEVKRNVVYLSTFVKENVRNKIKILIPFFFTWLEDLHGEVSKDLFQVTASKFNHI